MTDAASSTTQSPPPDPGGRDRRPAPAERRTAAIDALIDLVLEQGAHPRPEDVAERAGVSIASLYRYFSDLDELRRDAVTRIVHRFPDLFDISGIGGGDRNERIAGFASARFALHETLHRLQLLSAAMSQTDPTAATHVDENRRALADQVRRHFRPELETLSPAQRDDTVAAIGALTSVEAWEHFRRSYDRTPAQTRRAWTTALDHLLPDP